MNILRNVVRSSVQPVILRNVIKCAAQTTNKGSLVSSIKNSVSFNVSSFLSSRLSFLTQQERSISTLESIHIRRQQPYKPKKKRRPLDGNPFMKGVVLKTLIKKPKKPNSANRKCVLVRLTNGKEMVAYVPGIGHNLQEHSIVLCRVGRLQDCPGVKIKCVRGKYDLGHVIVNRP